MQGARKLNKLLRRRYSLSGSLTIVRAGYTFAGWNTKADGSGTSYAADAALTMGSA
ncbi:InlB B-repeat-containing protein [Sporosarcina limicola]|uniref:InlB B-repeat-containing protein n=1 Tax=Sporosarcina limicola TaxID=34101 RepID=UPI001CEEFDC3